VRSLTRLAQVASRRVSAVKIAQLVKDPERLTENLILAINVKDPVTNEPRHSILRESLSDPLDLYTLRDHK
jgi:hypothetical protein